MTKTGAAARPPISVDPDNLLDTVQMYRKQITIGAIVVAAAIGGVFLWKASEARKSAQAERAFLDAIQLYAQKDPKAAEQLAKVSTRYAGTNGGAQAVLIAAQVYFDGGKFDEGIKALDAASVPSAFAAGVEGMKAAGYEGKGDFAKAAEHFQAAAAKATLQGERDILKADLARSLGAAGKKEEAKKVWQEIADQSDSPMHAEALVRLGELSAAVAK